MRLVTAVSKNNSQIALLPTNQWVANYRSLVPKPAPSSPGGVLADEPERFSELFTVPDDKAPGVHWKYLVREGIEGDWSVFGEVAV